MVFAPMQGDDSSNDDSIASPGDATTTPTRLETHNDDGFEAELRDLELRLDQLELEQRSLRLQLQRARLRSAERSTAPSSAPPTTHSRPLPPSGRLSFTPERAPSHTGRNNTESRPLDTLSPHGSTTYPPDRCASHPPPTRQAQVVDQRTPQAGDRLDAIGQVLRVGDEVSFLATNYTRGGTATVRRFTATFVILRRDNGGEVRRAPSNVTRIHAQRSQW